ncbi:MAG: hypothetical protein JSU73_10060 [candidate division WOR-3 bacterium]|nr:MAG: hypothetical protein JSU73_10060 [candidate division WOR-3 bacterium]
MKSTALVCLIGLAVTASAEEVTVLGVLNTSDYQVSVDTVKFIYGTAPNWKFNTAWGGDPGTVDSIEFEVLKFPRNVALYYQINEAGRYADTLFGMLEDTWYELDVSFDAQPKVKFVDISGISESGTRVLGRVCCLPNPFRSAVSILPADTPGPGVRALVYDACGNVVRVLTREDRPGFVWDGQDANGRQVADGVYLCQVSSGRSAATVRLVKLTGR